MAAEQRPAERIFLDCEFTDLPWAGRSELFWIGVADEAGNSWSALCADVDLRRTSRFVQEHVLPRLPASEPSLSRTELAAMLVDVCGSVDEFWVWAPSAKDLVALGIADGDARETWRKFWDWDFQLMRELVVPWPNGWPDTCRDLHVLADDAGIALPPNPEAHHPAADARWNAEVFALATR